MKSHTIYILILFLCLTINCVHCFYKKPAHDNECKNEVNCKLPYCNCDSSEIPLNITHRYRIDELPQLVVLTIDDEQLDHRSYLLYKHLTQNMRNPNGCPINATFFLSDTLNQTSYCLTRNLYENGHEIAISTLHNECAHKLCNTNRTFESWTYYKWLQEIQQMRLRLERYASIPRSSISGFRAPIMQPPANLHLKIISSHKFVYDSSLVINDKNIVWPFTLDYNLKSSLYNIGPTQSFQNLWELPVHVYFDKSDNVCMNFWEGNCRYDRTVYGIAKFLRSNFLRAYYKNRSPFTLNIQSKWLKEETLVEKEPSKKFKIKQKVIKTRVLKNFEGVKRFIRQILKTNNDVYFVSAKEAIEWTRSLPIIMNSRRKVNLTDYLNRYVLNIDYKACRQSKPAYDGKCTHLRQKNPDYNITDSFDSITNDDDEDGGDGLNDDKMVKRIIQLELRSEFLFINNIFTYLALFLIFTYILVIAYDKFYV